MSIKHNSAYISLSSICLSLWLIILLSIYFQFNGLERAFAPFCPLNRPNCTGNETLTTGTENNNNFSAVESSDIHSKYSPLASEYFTNGHELANVQRHEEAIAEYDKALAIEPNMIEAHVNKGVSLADLGRHEEAIAEYDKALAIDQNIAPAYFNKGLAMSILQRYDESIAEYDKALAIDQNITTAHINKGIMLLYLDRHEEAIAEYDKALAIDQNITAAHANKGYSLAALERYEEAIAEYDKALAIEPKDAGAHLNKGVSLADLRRLEEAIAEYDKALAIDPGNDEAYNNKGVALGGLDRHEEAIAEYDKALAIDPYDIIVINNKGISLAELGRHEEAIAEYDKALAIDPGNGDIVDNKEESLEKLRIPDEKNSPSNISNLQISFTGSDERRMDSVYDGTGITVNYPYNWNLMETMDENKVILGAKDGLSRINISIDKICSANHNSLDSVSEIVQGNMKDRDYQILDINYHSDLIDKPGVEIMYISPVTSFKGIYTFTIDSENKMKYVVDYIAPISEYQNNSLVNQKIINSLQANSITADHVCSSNEDTLEDTGKESGQRAQNQFKFNIWRDYWWNDPNRGSTWNNPAS